MTTEIVTYHYVRSQEEGARPRVHGISVADFAAHLDLAETQGGIRSFGSVVDAIEEGRKLASGYVLTFDDGLRDHATVAAMLADRRLTGTFYVSADAVLRRGLLDVHMIHHILGCGEPAERLTARVVDHLAGEGIIAPVDEWPESGRFDVIEVRRLKGLLQRGLDDEMRASLIDRLFRQVVGADPKSVAEQLYLGLDDLRAMDRAGMEIGGHGRSHRHLTDLDPAALTAEMEASMEILDAVNRGRRPGTATFCYPHGSHDAAVEAATRAAGFRAAVTTHHGPVESTTSLLTIPRIDASELQDRVAAAGAAASQAGDQRTTAMRTERPTPKR